MRRIQKDNPSAARNAANTIYKGVTSLKDFPHRGRSGRIEGSRELLLAPPPYIAVYRIKGQIVEVSRIYHRPQDWP